MTGLLVTGLLVTVLLRFTSRYVNDVSVNSPSAFIWISENISQLFVCLFVCYDVGPSSS